MPSPPRRPATAAPVVVVGGGLAGMAAAARLAKAGHPVQLLERQDGLGGGWRAERQPDVGLVDAAPGVLGFPAPWRDLFRKSGRPLEAELARGGHTLVPAAATRYRFADGSELDLPAERGEQHRVLTARYGPAAAVRWRDLLDDLDDVWQALRPLGLEFEPADRRRLGRPVRARLHARRSLAALAAGLRQPQLEAVVRSVAHRHGAAPERTPAWVAVDLAVSRTFGHWQVQPMVAPDHAGDTGRSSVLAEALAGRLRLRRVAVHLETTAEAVLVEDGRATGVRTATGVLPAAAVVVATDPWQLVGTLLPGGVCPQLQRDVRRLRPAAAPTVTHHHLDEPSSGVLESVELTADGVPVLSYRRPVADGTLVSRHDYRRTRPDPAYGVAWRGFRQWRRRPAVVTELAGLYTASASSAAGNGPSPTILSGALASYACHDRLPASAGTGASRTTPSGRE